MTTQSTTSSTRARLVEPAPVDDSQHMNTAQMSRAGQQRCCRPAQALCRHEHLERVGLAARAKVS
jgi:hypothetical protein